MENKKIRLQKFLSQKGLFSRRQTEEFIRSKKIKINDRVAELGDRVTETDKIYVSGKILEFPKKWKRVVIAFNKPKGMETTLQKIEGIFTLADINFGVGRVFPIGRLDKDSHGLLVLTNDGDLANKLMHPRYQKSKEYLVTVHKEIDEKFLKTIASGIVLDKKRTASCQVEKLNDTCFKIILKEGRNRQIRRMCGALGYEVKDLERTRFGNIKLGTLKPGAWKKLSLVEQKNIDSDFHGIDV